MHVGNTLTKIFIIFATTILLSVAFVHPVSAIGDNYQCQDAEGNTIADRSKLIKVAIPIPGFVHEIICYEEQANEANGQTTTKEVLRYYYVESLSQYIANLYEYFVGIVGILASVMILYGGIRWILAAGNQSTIQSAKNIIFSAIIGVVIAFTSYLLLYLLNPRTVDYETLQTTLNASPVKAVDEYSPFCSDTANPVNADTGESTYIFHFISAGNYESSVRRETESTSGTGYYCGDKVGILTKGETYNPGDTVPICYGDKCTSGTCAYEASSNAYTCRQSFIKGSIQYVSNAYIDLIQVEGVCNNGEQIRAVGAHSPCLDITPSEDHANYYSSDYSGSCPTNQESALEAMVKACDDEDGFAGFYLNVEINDDQGALFNLWSTTDDNYMVGRDCTVVNSYKDPSKYTTDEIKTAIANGRFFTVLDFYDYVDTNNDGTPDTAILKKTPYVCNFNIGRDSFPAR